MFLSSLFAVNYSPGQSNGLFGSVRGRDKNIHFQFQGQAHCSVKKAPLNVTHSSRGVRGGERTLHIIMTMAVFEGENLTIFKKPDFLFEM